MQYDRAHWGKWWDGIHRLSNLAFEKQSNFRGWCYTYTSYILVSHLLVIEYHHFNTTSLSFDTPNFWDSFAVLAVTRRVLIFSWEPPSSGFIKVSFNDSIRGAKGGTEYIIRDSNGKLLATGGFSLFEPSIPEAELRVAWTGIIYTR